MLNKKELEELENIDFDGELDWDEFHKYTQEFIGGLPELTAEQEAELEDYQNKQAEEYYSSQY